MHVGIRGQATAVGVVVGLMATGMMMVASAAEPPAVSCKVMMSRTPLKDFATPETKAVDQDGTCVLSHLRFKPPFGSASWTVDTLRVAARQDPAQVGVSPPSSLRLEADGIRFVPVTANEQVRYMVSVTQWPFDGRVSYDWDKATGALQVHKVEVEGSHLGHVALAFDGSLPGDTVLTGKAPPNLRIAHVHLALDNRELVEKYLVPPLMGLLPPDSDPAIEFPKAQKALEDQIRRLPASAGDDGGTDALIRFIADFPHPTGHFEEDVTFGKPVGAADLMAGCGGDPLCGGHFRGSYKAAQAASAAAP